MLTDWPLLPDEQQFKVGVGVLFEGDARQVFPVGECLADPLNFIATWTQDKITRVVRLVISNPCAYGLTLSFVKQSTTEMQ